MRFALLLFALSASPYVWAQIVPDTLRAPADSIITYGWTVDADEERLLVGARIWPPPAAQSSSDPKGVVFVYRRDGAGEWVVEGRLDSDDISNQDCFSWSMDLHGDLAAIGAECERGPDPDGDMWHGVVYLFRYDGTAWGREAKLYGSDVTGPHSPASYFGESVSLGPDYLVVGAGNTPNPKNPASDIDSGAAFVFERLNGTWTHTATLVNDDADQYLNEYVGGAVAALGDVVLVGAHSLDEEGAPNRGAVYVFERSSGTWSQRARLMASDPTDQSFGALVAMGGDGALIGTWRTGVYPAEEVDSIWTVGERLILDEKPTAIARSGDTALVVGQAKGYLFDLGSQEEPETILPLTPYAQWRDELASLNSRYAFVGHPDFYDLGYVLVYDRAEATATVPDAPTPQGWSLAPNPTPGATTVRFTLPEQTPVRLSVYDLLGREVGRLVDRPMPAGSYTVPVASGRLAPGHYLVRLTLGTAASSRRLTVVR